jgi:hypothetical protein
MYLQRVLEPQPIDKMSVNMAQKYNRVEGPHLDNLILNLLDSIKKMINPHPQKEQNSL